MKIHNTIDPNGRILSMNYNEIRGYSWELFYIFGNMVALTNTQGNVIVGYLYDLSNGAKLKVNTILKE